MGHRSQTHCKHGHEFTPDNTYWQKGGKYRRCKTCTQADNKLWEVYKRTSSKMSKLRRAGFTRHPVTGKRI